MEPIETAEHVTTLTPAAYFLSHDDDIARELEALAGAPEADLRTALDLAAADEDVVAEIEAYAEVYTATGPGA
jgi:hypothetical protein